jgi:DNA-binding transcriptional MerR regulator
MPRALDRHRPEGGVMIPLARMIIKLNIKHYRALLDTERDAGKRETIKQLLAEEEQKLIELDKRIEDGADD